MTAPTPPKDGRFKTGISLMILSLSLPFASFLVPLLGLSTVQSTLVVGFLCAGAPEVLLLAAVALLGKESFDHLVATTKKFLRQTFLETPASRPRYYAGLALSLLNCLPAYFCAYAPSWMPEGKAKIYLLVGADLAFILSIFIMGGEFWGKFRRLFVWEEKV